MATSVAAPAASRPPRLIEFTPQLVVLLILAAAAAAWTWSRASSMGNMPGTMGLGMLAFIVMWAMMMAAMMLPTMAPFAALYARTVQQNRGSRLIAFGGGYATVWMATGIPAFALAWLGGRYASDTTGTMLAVLVFASCGLYQLTPIKARCLAHCRSPFGHLLHFANFRGPLRDLRAGIEHGWFCLACCWSLMLLMIAFGVMNVPAMVLLGTAVGLEKLWRWGEWLSRGIGAGALVAAILVLWVPELAPGLIGSPSMANGAMSGMSAG